MHYYMQIKHGWCLYRLEGWRVVESWWCLWGWGGASYFPLVPGLCKHILYLPWFTCKLAQGYSQARGMWAPPNPCAPAHRGFKRGNRIINKKNMLTVERWRSFITHVHRSTHKYISINSILSAARGECDAHSCLFIRYACIMCTHVHL